MTNEPAREAAIAAISAAAITLSRHEGALAAMAKLTADATPEELLLRPLAEKALALSRGYKTQLTLASAFMEAVNGW